MPDITQQRFDAISDSLEIGSLERHILPCGQQSIPRCSTVAESSVVWWYLKRRLKELGLSSARGRSGDGPRCTATGVEQLGEVDQ